MKVTPLDFILSGFFMMILWVSSAAIVFCGITNLWPAYFGAYSAILNIFFLVTIYGVLSGFLLRLMLIVRPIKTGEFDFESPEFTYWKLLTMLHYFGEHTLLIINVEPVRPLIAQLFGACVGSNVAIGGKIDSPFLVRVGDGCTVGNGSLVTANLISTGKLILGPVEVRSGAVIGVGAIVMPNTTLGEKCLVSPYSVVMPGTQIPDGESWKGQPARKWQ